MLKILKYAAYIELIQDIARAIKAAKRGETFEVEGNYRVDGRHIDILITGTPR